MGLTMHWSYCLPTLATITVWIGVYLALSNLVNEGRVIARLDYNAAAHFIDIGQNSSSKYTVPEEVEASGFQICPGELESIVEGRDVQKFKVHGGVEGIAQKLSTSITNGISTSELLLRNRKEIYELGDYKQLLQIKNLDKKKHGITVQVARDGVRQKISIHQLLPGDIVHLCTGDWVPANGIFVSGSFALIDEFHLTGEIEPVNVNARSPFLLAGAKVQDGSFKMLVTTVVMRTQWGEWIASQIERGDNKTPFQVTMNGVLSIGLFFAAGVSCGLVGLLFSHDDASNSNGTLSFEDLVRQLVVDLESPLTDKQKQAANKIRLLAPNNLDIRIKIANAGAIKPLISLISSSDLQLQEDAVTAILNLALCDKNKELIASSGAIKSLAEALKYGTPKAQRRAARALFELSQTEKNKIEIGQSGAFPDLVRLLENRGFEGKKDALKALISVCSVRGNKITALVVGVMNPLLELMADSGSNLVEKSACLVFMLVSLTKAKNALVEKGGIQLLVRIIAMGSPEQKEMAVAILLQVCNSRLDYLAMVEAGGAVPQLVTLSKTGTDDAKQKANILLLRLDS